MVIWVKFTHPVHFTSLIPRMSMFTLAICLTISNLPWFIQVPMQYCSYSIETCFYHQSHPQLDIVFTLAPSLYSFWSYFSTDLQKHIVHLPTWGAPLSVSYHFAFSYCSWVLKARILKWFAIPFSSGPHSVRPLHHDPPILGGPTRHSLVSLS